MKATDNQIAIMRYLANVETATKVDLYCQCSKGYFHNGMKHFGDILTRMVKQGMISRVSKGVYKLGGKKSVLLDKNQLNLNIE